MSRHFPSFSISDKDAKGLVDDAFTSATIELNLLFCMKRGIFMEDERIINAERFSKIWWQSRYDAHMTQEKLALGLGVSRKTIQNWEKGISSPTLFESMEWFRILGLNPMPYYMAYLFPEDVGDIKGSDGDDRIENALSVLVDQLPVSAKRQLLYILFGNHGSSPTAVLNLMNAHLQCPLRDRISHAVHIAENYELNEAMGCIVRPDNIKPDQGLLHESIESAKGAVINGKKGYVNPQAV